jgi:hypothetical protein
MDREHAARAAGVIPEKKLAKFLEYLVRHPETPKLADEPHQSEERLQGDILKDFPFCIIDAGGSPRTATPMVALLNNTCDLQHARSALVNVALAFDYRAFRDHIVSQRGEKKADGYLGAVMRNDINELLYVRDCPGFPEGLVIRLDNVASVNTELYEKALQDKRRIASFTQNGFYVFLLKLANYFARAETPDVDRAEVAVPE